MASPIINPQEIREEFIKAMTTKYPVTTHKGATLQRRLNFILNEAVKYRTENSKLRDLNEAIKGSNSNLTRLIAHNDTEITFYSEAFKLYNSVIDLENLKSTSTSSPKITPSQSFDCKETSESGTAIVVQAEAITRLKKELNETYEAVAKLRSERTDADETIAKLRSEKGELESQRRRETVKFETLTGEFQTKLSAHETLRREMQDLRNQYKAQQKQMAKLVEEARAAKKVSEEARSKIDEQAETIAKLKSNLSNKHQALEKARKTITQLKIENQSRRKAQEVTELRDQLKVKDAHIETLNKKIKEHESEAQAFRDRSIAKERQTEEERAKYHLEAETRIDSLRKELYTMSEERMKMTSCYEENTQELTKQIASLQEQLEKLKADDGILEIAKLVTPPDFAPYFHRSLVTIPWTQPLPR